MSDWLYTLPPEDRVLYWVARPFNNYKTLRQKTCPELSPGEFQALIRRLHQDGLIKGKTIKLRYSSQQKATTRYHLTAKGKKLRPRDPDELKGLKKASS